MMSDLSSFLDQLANRFSEGWHDGIKIDATDIVDMGKAADHIRKLEAKVARVKQEKADALNVRSKDGLLSSEWITRTGAAERRAEAAEAENITIRNAQKACETCDGQTIAEFKEMKAEVARLR